MFKKVEIWVIYLVIFLSIFSAIGFGMLVRQELVGSVKFGWLSKGALFLAEIPSTLKNIDSRSDPFKTYSVEVGTIAGFDGITNDKESYLLISRFNPQERRSIIELIDLRSFKVIHTWKPNINEINKGIDSTEDSQFHNINIDNSPSRYRPFHPFMLSNGDLIIKSHRTPLVKIDKNSKLVWREESNRYHHSTSSSNENAVWVPAHKYPHSYHLSGAKYIDQFLEDAIVKIDFDGNILFQKSLHEILKQNGLESLMWVNTKSDLDDNDVIGDPFHLNDIEEARFNSVFWERGDLFLSLRQQNAIFIYRPSTNKVVDIIRGPFFKQHDVHIINEKEIAIFNNNSKKGLDRKQVEPHSSILIYDFETKQYKKYLDKSLKAIEFWQESQGLFEITQEGDLMLDYTKYGQIYYFNANGELRWKYSNLSANGQSYYIFWPRLIHDGLLLQNVRTFLKNHQ